MSLAPTQEQASMQEDLNAMMRDPRYLTDPAFRQEVMGKLMSTLTGSSGSVFKLSDTTSKF